MKKTLFKSTITAKNYKDNERVFGSSITVPDQNLSVRQILYKSQNGTLGTIAREPIFSEDQQDLRGLDISELYQMQQNARKNVENIQNEIRHQENLKAQLKVQEQNEKLKKLAQFEKQEELKKITL